MLPEMVGFLLGVQKVELVGGEGWLAHNSGSLVLALAAFLAAYVASRNHRQQLENDRHLRNKEHMQDAVDSALESINVTTDKLGDLGACAGTRDEKKLEWAEAEEPTKSFRQWQRESSGALREAFDGLMSMRFDRARLELRFSGRHPIVVRHQAVQAELQKWYDSLAEGVQKGFDQTLEHLLVTLEDTNSGGAISAFKSACREWFDD
jgi:hypothetical protein